LLRLGKVGSHVAQAVQPVTPWVTRTGGCAMGASRNVRTPGEAQQPG
jgi:hypothetical protein